MTMDKVTSLFDLEIKVKENSYYRQLVAMTSSYVAGNWWYSFQGKKISDSQYQQSLDYLCRYFKGNRTCQVLCETLNGMRGYVKPVEEPVEVKEVPKANTDCPDDEDDGYYRYDYYDDD